MAALARTVDALRVKLEESNGAAPAGADAPAAEETAAPAEAPAEEAAAPEEK
jgi:large subunit ribosomal protein L10